MRVLIVFLLLCLSLHLGAQVQVEIQEVLVEAEAEDDAIREQKEAGTAKLVVSSKSINNLGHNTAGDVLKRMPRILVQGPPSFNRNIMMAGLDKQFQTVLINGNRPAGGEDSRDFKLDRIPVDMIEKIEIVYNPPAIYGSDATIGLVNLVLKDTPDKEIISTDLSLDYTTTEPGINPEFTFSYGNKWNKWSFYGSYSLNRFKRNNELVLSDTSVSGTANEALDVWLNGFMTTFAFEPDSTQLWKLQSFFSDYQEDAYYISDVKRRTKGGLSVAADTANDAKHRMLHTHTLSYTKKWNNGTLESGLNFAQHYDMKDRWRWRENSQGLEVSYEDEYQRNSEALLFSDYTYKIKGSRVNHTLKTGIKASYLDRTYDRMVYTKLSDHLFWDDISDGSYVLDEQNLGFYASDAISVNRFWIMPALRVDGDSRYFKTVEDEGSKSYWNFNPSLHMKYTVMEDFYIKADIARQMSRPPFNLMVPIDKVKNKKQKIERGNPELIPSTAINMGLGIEKYFKKSNYIMCRGFYTSLQNVIETREVGIDDNYGYRIYQAVNVDSGLVWGADVNLRWNIVKKGFSELSLLGNVSWLGSEVRDPGTQEIRRLNEQPEWIANTSLDYINTRLRFQCSVGINYIGERYVSSTIDEGTVVDRTVYAPFSQVDFRFKYFYSSKGSVYLNVVNVFDAYNYVTQGIVEETEYIGRNITLGTSFRF